MCGRYTLRTPIQAVADAFDLLPIEHWAAREARYNIAPSQDVAAVRTDAERHGRALVELRWGLIPSWADDPAIGNRMINARGETVATRPAFRDAFRRRRCLLPADGFYEWRRHDGGKQPYYIRLADEGVFAFAGLWERWHHDELTIESCTIITTDANALVRPLHDRMPVILDPKSYDQWLDPTFDDREALQKLLRPYPADKMIAYPVSTLVNSPRHEAPECIAPAAPQKTQGSLFE